MISKNYPIVYMKVFSCFDYHCVSDLYWKNYIWSFSGCIHLLVHKLWYPDFSPSPIIPMSIWHDKSMVVECLSDTPIYLKILTILIFFFFLFKNRDKREKKGWGFSIKDILFVASNCLSFSVGMGTLLGTPIFLKIDYFDSFLF